MDSIRNECIRKIWQYIYNELPLTFDYNALRKYQYMNVVCCIDALLKQLKTLALEFNVEVYILGLGRSCKNLGLKLCGKF